MYPAIKQLITTAGFVPVRLPANHGCNSFSLWTEDGVKWIYSHNADGDRPIEITSNGTACLPLELSIIHGKNPDGDIICYAKGTTSTNLVGLITKQ